MNIDPITIVVFGSMLILSLVVLITSICDIKDLKVNKKSSKSNNETEAVEKARSVIISSTAVITFSTILIGNLI